MSESASSPNRFDPFINRTTLASKIRIFKSLNLSDPLAALEVAGGYSPAVFEELLGPIAVGWFSGLADPKLSELAELEARLGIDLITFTGQPGYFNRLTTPPNAPTLGTDENQTPTPVD